MMNRPRSEKLRPPHLELVLAAANTILVVLIVGVDGLAAGEMVWRLWISCLVAGGAVFFVTIFFSALSPFRDRKIGSPFKALGVVLFLLAGFQAAEDATGSNLLAAAGPYVALVLLALFFFPLETLFRKCTFV